MSHIKLVAGRVIVARLDGQLDFLELVGHSYLSHLDNIKLELTQLNQLYKSCQTKWYLVLEKG